jgi:NAD(P)H dehydrogenase (quinone)
MNVLYVYCHPLEDSFHATLRKEALAGLKEAGHTIDLLDLYAEGFDPVLSAERRRDYHDPVRNRANNQAYVDRLMAANALVVQFPTWSFGPPAMLKGWFDRMFGPRWIFPTRRKQSRCCCKSRGSRVFRPTAARAGRRSGWPTRRARSSSGICHGLRAPKPVVRYYALYHMNTATPARRSRFLAKVRQEMARF